ncbi:MAG: hypothetical protein Q9175_003718 [Cornicularia normoerica]
MAMIHQLNRSNGQPTPYFVRAPTGPIPYATAHLMSDYSYPCSPHCRGVAVAAWLGSAAAPAPMKELDLALQLAQDQAEFAAEPHAQLYPPEMDQWRHLYRKLITYNPDEPTNGEPRKRLRALHTLAVDRHNWWASQQTIAPAPPPANPGMPPA